MFENIRGDLRQARLFNHKGLAGLRLTVAPFFHLGTQAVLTYRFGRWAARLPIPGVRHVLMIAYYVMKYVMQIASGVNIPTSADIAPGLVVHTWCGVYIPACKIGKNCYFQHGVVVGYGCLGIGDDVYFGPGAKVIRPVRIGHRAKIGANAVVLEDVADDTTVAGIPAKPVRSSKAPLTS